MKLTRSIADKQRTPQSCTFCSEDAVVVIGRAVLCGDCFLKHSRNLRPRRRPIRNPETANHGQD